MEMGLGTGGARFATERNKTNYWGSLQAVGLHGKATLNILLPPLEDTLR